MPFQQVGSPYRNRLEVLKLSEKVMARFDGDKTIARRERYRFVDALCIATDITDAEFRVAYQLMTYMPPSLNGECYPAVETLALKLQCSERKVQTYLKSLVWKGWFKRLPPRGSRTNRYTPNWETAQRAWAAHKNRKLPRTGSIQRNKGCIFASTTTHNSAKFGERSGDQECKILHPISVKNPFDNPLHRHLHPFIPRDLGR